ncbi:MAG: cytochrome c [Burkholderiales bacterium]
MTRGAVRLGLAALAIGALLIALIAWLNLRGEDPLVPDAAAPTSPELIARGAYLARAGNCMGCHTDRGGAAYAGGRGVPTPFGTVFAPNLTPDTASGLGAWTAAEFWRALHNGRARDGRLLYPAFPYPNYTRVTRADSDAIFAFLRSLPAVAQPNRGHTLQFPFDQPAALAIWRALYFRPAPSAPAQLDQARSPEWTRGAYLVEGLGHCNACHASRNALGATASPLDLAGGLIPVQNWYAPSLASPLEAGVADWSDAHVVELLRTGVSARGAVMGPMSEVVSGSTQHLSESDLRAMATYLKALPPPTSERAAGAPALSTTAATGPGAKLYDTHCTACHGERGEGVPGVYPALAASRAVVMHTPANLVHMVLEGGFPPATGGNPRPYGMPPFATVLSNDEVAQLLTHIRSSWGNQGAPVSALDVTRFRGVSAR